MAIVSLRIDEEGKGKMLEKEDLPKINNNEIDVRNIEEFPVEVICGKYRFNVDENFIVTYVGEVDGTVVTYTTDPEGYTNGDTVKILIKVSNSKGIKTIEYPDGDKLECNGNMQIGIDYEVTKNGTYTFKVIDNEDKEVVKDIVIDQIDKLAPIDFTPEVEINKDSITIIENGQDAETDGTSTKSGIDYYEYYLTDENNKTKKYDTNKIEGIATGTYHVYLIAYDKAGNNTKSSEEEIIISVAIEESLEYPLLTSDGIQNYKNTLTGNYEFSIDIDCTASDALGKGAYDNDDTTFAGYYNLETGNPNSGIKSEVNKYVQIDSSAVGKELSIDWQDGSSGVTITMQTLDSSKEVLTTLEQANGKRSIDSITITSAMKWIRFKISEGYVSHGRVYEMYYSTKVALDYPLVTTTGIVNYLDSKTGKYGLDTKINCTASDALPVQCYDGNESTYVSMIKSNIFTTGKLKLSDEFKKSGYNLRFKATLISGTQSGVYIQCGSVLNNLGNYKYWNALTKSGSYYLVDNVIDECYYIWFNCISSAYGGYNLYEVYYK